MTVTGRGLVVANANKLQYLQRGPPERRPSRHDRGRPLDLDHHRAERALAGVGVARWLGRLHEFNLGSGAVTTQDFTGEANDPLFNNWPTVGNTCGSGPVANSGGISADGQGGIWLANGGNDRQPRLGEI